MNPALSHSGSASRLRAMLRESPPLLWAFLYFFFLLTAYYLVRPVREAMGSSGDVATLFPASMVQWFAARGVALSEITLQFLFTCTFVIMLLLQPVYGALVARFPRRVFLPTVYVAFILCLVGFYFAFDSKLPGRGMVFFLWVTVFNLFAVTVFWSFMADVYTDSEARRVYGYIGAGGTLGALLGPFLTRMLAERVGLANLLLVSAVLLSLCVLCIVRLRPHAVAREQRLGLVSGEIPMGGGVLAGLGLIAREPLLRWMAVLMVFAVGVGTLLYSEQAQIARRFFADDAERTSYFAGIDLAVNGLTLLVQLFITRWLLSRYGVAPALLIPAAAIVLGFSLLAASPYPVLVAIVQVATRAGEFSLGKPARESIYTRVGREWRYKSGAAIDTVVYRGGDLCFIWVHKALTVAGAGSSAVFLLGIGAALGMTVGALGVIREQRRLQEVSVASRGTAPAPG